MGDSPAPPTQESTAEALSAWSQFLPTLMSQANAQVLPTEMARLGASQATSPQIAALNQLLYSTYGPQAAATSADINRQNMLSAAESENQVLEQQGNRLGKNYLDFANLVDPEYFKTREAAGNAAQQLLSPTLSGGEREEVQRSVNQSNEQRGLNTAPSKLSTVENAMTFGNSLRERLGQALNVTGSVMPSFRSGITPQGIGASSTQNAGESHFTGVQQPSNNAFDMANSFLGGVTNLQAQKNQINANRRDPLDRFNETFSGVVGSL